MKEPVNQLSWLAMTPCFSLKAMRKMNGQKRYTEGRLKAWVRREGGEGYPNVIEDSEVDDDEQP